MCVPVLSILVYCDILGTLSSLAVNTGVAMLIPLSRETLRSARLGGSRTNTTTLVLARTGRKRAYDLVEPVKS